MCGKDDEICIVMDLVKGKPFLSRSLEEQKSIIQMDRPQPPLTDAVQIISGRFRYFLPKYYEEQPWFCGCPLERKIFCWWCLLFSTNRIGPFVSHGYNNFHNYTLMTRRHKKLPSHISAAIAFANYGDEQRYDVATPVNLEDSMSENSQMATADIVASTSSRPAQDGATAPKRSRIARFESPGHSPSSSCDGPSTSSVSNHNGPGSSAKVVDINMDNNVGKLTEASVSKLLNGSSATKIRLTTSNLRDRLRNVPAVASSYFTGRKEELRQMTKYAERSKRRSDPCHPIDITITGPIGCGKTDLMLKFIQENSSNFHHILWHKWESELTTKEFFIYVAKELKIEMPEELDNPLQYQAIVSKMFNVLCKHKTLLVFDNVEGNEVFGALPTAEVDQIHPITVAITSHNVEWEANLKINLDYFSLHCCQMYLQKHFTQYRDSELKDLAEFAERIPAIMSNILKVMKKRKFFDKQQNKIDEFILSHKNKYCYLCRIPVCEEMVGVPKILTSSLAVITKAIIRSDSSVNILLPRILNIMSFLDPEEILDSTFNSILVSKNQDDIANVLTLLEQFSLIKHRGDKIIVTKMVQKLVRCNYDLNKEPFLFLTLTLLEKDIDLTGRYPKFNTESFAAHAMKVLTEEITVDHIKLYSKLPVAIVNTIGVFAKSFWETQLFQNLELTLGYGNLDLIQLITLVCDPPNGISLIKSLKMLESTMEKIPVELKGHRDVYRLSFKRAFILNALERYEESWTVLNELYIKQRDTLGVDNEDTVECLEKMCEVAAKIAKLGKVDSIESTLSHVYQRFSNTHLDHVKSLCMMKYIPEYLHGCSKDEEALRLYDCLHETLETLNGETDSMALQTLMAKADCLLWLQKFEEAWEVFMTLNTKQISSKIENSKTIVKLCTTAGRVEDLDKKSKCWEFCFSLIEEKIKNPESDPEHIFFILQDLCLNSNKQMKTLEMFEKLQKTITTPNFHPFNQRIIYGKLDCLLRTEKYEEAWVMLQYLYKIQCENKLDIVRTVSTMCQVACEIELAHNFNEWLAIMNSITDFELALVILEKVVSFNSPKTSRVLPYYEKMIVTLNATFGEKSPPVLRTMLGMAWHLWCLEQQSQAWKLYEDVCRVLDQVPEPRTTRRWDFCNFLGKLIKLIKEGASK